ncbi:MAG: hypothetical protein EKK41_14205, partial [Hyphomicrobiales bacterium]
RTYARSQPAPLVPERAYDAAFGTTTSNTYARIQDTSATFFNGPLSTVELTGGGSGYDVPPDVSISGGGGAGAQATATLAPRSVGTLSLSSGGGGYTSVPSVAITGGGGAGATATAVVGARALSGVAVSANGSNYATVPSVVISGGGGSGATAIAVVSGRRVTSILLTSAGSGYTSPPTVTLSGGGGSGARGTAVLGGASVTGLTLTAPGTGFTSPPTVTIVGGGGTGAAATATLSPAAVASLSLTSAGDGYTASPTVSFSGGGGSGATALAHGLTMTLQPKSIVEDFDPTFGRMNAMLGTEVPNTNATTQTSIPDFDTDPPTEVLRGTPAATRLGSAADGTQIWKITHNGVDTHAVHWHMFDVQVINRVGWDGAIRPPDPNEIGWKDTVRMNPLEDVIVALRPILPDVPFELPNSVRPLDPTSPLGSTLGFHNVDPTNQPAPVTNKLVNFGWEYVWHCHLLGHEENSMMRPMAVAVAPVAPTGLTAQVVGRTVRLLWRDQSINETSFIVQRARSASGPWATITTGVPPAAGSGSTVNFIDTSVASGSTYVYRVLAANVVGYVQSYAAPAVGYPTASAESPSSGISNAVTP